MNKNRFYIFGSEHPKNVSKAHIYDDENSKVLCGASGYWMEAGNNFETDGKKVIESDGVSNLNFDQYIDCKTCNKKFREKFLSANPVGVKKRRLTKFERLAKRIKKDMGYDLIDFRRTNAGVHMKGSGAFVWCAKIKDTNLDISSTITATELLKKEEPIRLLENTTLSQLWEVI